MQSQTCNTSLEGLGLNVYPTEDERTGPELLDALAVAWSGRRVPAGRFDMFLGQVREAWRHLDPDNWTSRYVSSQERKAQLSTQESNELADVFLPDDRSGPDRFRNTGNRFLEMRPQDARRKAAALLAATNVKRASMLEERFLIDGDRWTERG